MNVNNFQDPKFEETAEMNSKGSKMKGGGRES